MGVAKTCATCSLQLPKRAKHKTCSTCRKVAQLKSPRVAWSTSSYAAKSLGNRARRMKALEGNAA